MKKDTFFKSAFKIAIPVALQAMLQSSFSMVDQLMVGQLGKEAIAAVEIGSKPGFVFAFVSGAVATVTGIMVSQYMGKEDEEKINVSMSVNMCVMMLIAVMTALACFFAPYGMAGIFTEDKAVAAISASYISIVAFIYPLSGIATILAVHIRCRDHSEYPLYVSAAASVVNTVLNYVLIFGNFGAPKLEVKGAAIASLFSQVVNLALMIFFYVKTCSFKFDLRMNKEEIGQYVVMLLPVVFNEFLWTVGQNVNTYIYGHMGTDELAGMSITGPIQGLIIGALSGLA